MYFFLFDAIAAPRDGNPEIEGYAVVWVNSARYPDAERAALEHAGARGLTVRGIHSAHKPTSDDLARMSLRERSARSRGLEDGVWGYFVARQDPDLPVGTRIKARPLTKPREPRDKY